MQNKMDQKYNSLCNSVKNSKIFIANSFILRNQTQVVINVNTNNMPWKFHNF